jgi:hypothetical protein
MSQSVPRPGIGHSLLRVAIVFACLAPAACIPFGGRQESSSNPFHGVWQTADHDEIAFGDDTVELAPPKGKRIPITAAQCNGGYFFHYGRMTRDSLLGTTASQPDVKNRLSAILKDPVYPVAEMGCDHGTSTYVLLDPSHLVVIYRDRDVVGLDRMKRP